MHQTMNFGDAVLRLKAGGSVTREGWGCLAILCLQVPDANSKMSVPYMYLEVGASRERAPWSPTHTDLLAEDWLSL